MKKGNVRFGKTATVSAAGIVKGKKPGTAIITATYANQTFTYQVIVLSQYNAYLSKVSFSAKEEPLIRLPIFFRPISR